MPLITSLPDAIRSVLPHFRSRGIQQTQHYTKSRLVKLFFEDSVEDITGGDMYGTSLALRDSNNFKWVGVYDSLPATVNDIMGQIGTGWSHFLERGVSYSTIERSVNSGPEKLYNLIDQRTNAQYRTIWRQIEDALVSAGATVTPTATDPPQLRGLQYWLPYCITSGNVPFASPNGGFDGVLRRFADGTTATSIGSVLDETGAGVIDQTAVENNRGRSYCMTYSGNGDQALIKQITAACLATEFESIPMQKDAAGRTTRRVGLFPTVIYNDLVNLLNKRGTDSGGKDLNPFMDFEIGGKACMECPSLNGLAELPIYFVDSAIMYGRTLKGRFMNPMDPVQSQDSPQSYDVPMEGSCMVHCENPREVGFVIHIPLAA